MRIIQVSRATAFSIAANATVLVTNPNLADLLVPLAGKDVTIVEASVTAVAADASNALMLRYLHLIHLWADSAGTPINIGSTPSNIRLPVDSQWNNVSAGIPLANTLFYGAALQIPVLTHPADVVGTVQPTQVGLRGAAGITNSDAGAAHTVTVTLSALFEIT